MLCSRKCLLLHFLFCVRLSIGLQLPKFPKLLRSSVATAAAIAVWALSGATPSPAATADFDFSNGGHVRIDEPFRIRLLVRDDSLLSSPPSLWKNPVLVGYGGGGAVFAFDPIDPPPKELSPQSSLLVKISWSNTANSVRRECQTLQYLESKHVASAERCLGSMPYPYDSDRVMIAVTPYVDDAVATVTALDTPQLQQIAVKQICQTLVQMLANDVVTIDVQPLISQSTGDVIFIDMTEAVLLRPPFSFLDQTLMASFCSEMLALIPEKPSSFMDLARHTVLAEIERLEGQGTTLSTQAKDILFAQSLLFPDT